MEGKGRRRAPGMRPQQRREMIVRTALPLVAEHGTAVSTGQIASLFMGLAFTRARPPGGPSAGAGASEPSMEEYLDVFLHGALKEGTTE